MKHDAPSFQPRVSRKRRRAMEENAKKIAFNLSRFGASDLRGTARLTGDKVEQSDG
jgi:hypothetical protein